MVKTYFFYSLNLVLLLVAIAASGEAKERAHCRFEDSDDGVALYMQPRTAGEFEERVLIPDDSSENDIRTLIRENCIAPDKVHSISCEITSEGRETVIRLDTFSQTEVFRITRASAKVSKLGNNAFKAVRHLFCPTHRAETCELNQEKALVNINNGFGIFPLNYKPSDLVTTYTNLYQLGFCRDEKRSCVFAADRNGYSINTENKVFPISPEESLLAMNDLVSAGLCPTSPLTGRAPAPHQTRQIESICRNTFGYREARSYREQCVGLLISYFQNLTNNLDILQQHTTSCLDSHRSYEDWNARLSCINTRPDLESYDPRKLTLLGSFSSSQEVLDTINQFPVTNRPDKAFNCQILKSPSAEDSKKLFSIIISNDDIDQPTNARIDNLSLGDSLNELLAMTSLQEENIPPLCALGSENQFPFNPDSCTYDPSNRRYPIRVGEYHFAPDAYPTLEKLGICAFGEICSPETYMGNGVGRFGQPTGCKEWSALQYNFHVPGAYERAMAERSLRENRCAARKAGRKITDFCHSIGDNRLYNAQ